MNWFRHQDMRPAKGYDGHNIVGGLVKARKIREYYKKDK